jgi:hypothetical protein
MKRLGVADIARVLRQYDGRYRWLDVFADQVRELVSPVEGIAIRSTGPEQYIVQTPTEALDVHLDRARNVARWSLSAKPEEREWIPGALVGAVLGGLIASDERRKRPEDIVLGMLVGGLLGNAMDPDRNRIMTLRYEPKTQRWQVYNGPYVQWAKEALKRKPTG